MKTQFNLLGAAPQDTGGAVGCDLVQTDLNGKSFTTGIQLKKQNPSYRQLNDKSIWYMLLIL